MYEYMSIENPDHSNYIYKYKYVNKLDEVGPIHLEVPSFLELGIGICISFSLKN